MRSLGAASTGKPRSLISGLKVTGTASRVCCFLEAPDIEERFGPRESRFCVLALPLQAVHNEFARQAKINVALEGGFGSQRKEHVHHL